MILCFKYTSYQPQFPYLCSESACRTFFDFVIKRFAVTVIDTPGDKCRISSLYVSNGIRERERKPAAGPSLEPRGVGHVQSVEVSAALLETGIRNDLYNGDARHQIDPLCQNI